MVAIQGLLQQLPGLGHDLGLAVAQVAFSHHLVDGVAGDHLLQGVLGGITQGVVGTVDVEGILLHRGHPELHGQPDIDQVLVLGEQLALYRGLARHTDIDHLDMLERRRQVPVQAGILGAGVGAEADHQGAFLLFHLVEPEQQPDQAQQDREQQNRHTAQPLAAPPALLEALEQLAEVGRQLTALAPRPLVPGVAVVVTRLIPGHFCSAEGE